VIRTFGPYFKRAGLYDMTGLLKLTIIFLFLLSPLSGLSFAQTEDLEVLDSFDADLTDIFSDDYGEGSSETPLPSPGSSGAASGDLTPVSAREDPAPKTPETPKAPEAEEAPKAPATPPTPPLVPTAPAASRPVAPAADTPRVPAQAGPNAPVVSSPPSPSLQPAQSPALPPVPLAPAAGVPAAPAVQSPAVQAPATPSSQSPAGAAQEAPPATPGGAAPGISTAQSQPPLLPPLNDADLARINQNRPGGLSAEAPPSEAPLAAASPTVASLSEASPLERAPQAAQQEASQATLEEPKALPGQPSPALETGSAEYRDPSPGEGARPEVPVSPAAASGEAAAGSVSVEDANLETGAEEDEEISILQPETRRVTGTVVQPPPPPWLKSSRDASGRSAYNSGGAIPDFDSTNSHWVDMEVGEYDRPVRNTPAPTPTLAPTPASTQTQAPISTPVRSSPTAPTLLPAQASSGPLESQTGGQLSPEGQGSAQGSGQSPPTPPEEESGDRRQLRDLFQDMLPPPPTAQDNPPNQGSVTGSLTPPPGGAAGGPSGGALTPPIQVPPGLSGSSGAQAPILPPVEASPDSASSGPVIVVRDPMAESQTPSAPPPSITPPPVPDDPNSGPAIGRAGALMVESGPSAQTGPKGSAAILAPSSPAATVPAPKSSPGAASKSQGTGTQSASPPKNGSQGSKRPAPAAPLRPNLSVVIINESGSPEAAESYRAVLSSIGYRVLSVSQRQNSSPGNRQTVIAYGPGKESQARALARRIPGEKIMAKGDGLPADTVVIIR
jgi:hypothetical protein